MIVFSTAGKDKTSKYPQRIAAGFFPFSITGSGADPLPPDRGGG
jgi:hypothetical protein